MIYLGLKTAIERKGSFSDYKYYVDWWAKKAKLDIELENLQVG